jgi:hypothetical protein
MNRASPVRHLGSRPSEKLKTEAGLDHWVSGRPVTLAVQGMDRDCEYVR